MNIEKQFDIIIKNSIEDNETDPELHLIEEMSELIQEVSKKLRSKENNILDEMGDVFFQMMKVLRPLGLTETELKVCCIHKTRLRFPDQMEDRSTK